MSMEITRNARQFTQSHSEIFDKHEIISRRQLFRKIALRSVQFISFFGFHFT